jgi:hypothetical protein
MHKIKILVKEPGKVPVVNWLDVDSDVDIYIVLGHSHAFATGAVAAGGTIETDEIGRLGEVFSLFVLSVDRPGDLFNQYIVSDGQIKSVTGKFIIAMADNHGNFFSIPDAALAPTVNVLKSMNQFAADKVKAANAKLNPTEDGWLMPATGAVLSGGILGLVIAKMRASQ